MMVKAVRQPAAVPNLCLVDLTGELVNLVHHHALASGHTTILCASRRVYSEAH